MKCHYCPKNAVYKCSVCDRPLCGDHASLRTLCLECVRRVKLGFAVKRTTSTERKKQIPELVKRFWGEEEQLTFDRRLKVTELPGYVAKIGHRTAGFIATSENGEDIIIVALGVLPQYQGSGIGRSLVEKVEKEASEKKKKRLLVSTSNDDLPALAFYQSIGFQIYDVKPNVIAQKHGKVITGIGGLPVRDELRLQKRL